MAEEDQGQRHVLNVPGQVAVAINGVEWNGIAGDGDDVSHLLRCRGGQGAKDTACRSIHGRQDEQLPLTLRRGEEAHQAANRLGLRRIGAVIAADAEEHPELLRLLDLVIRVLERLDKLLGQVHGVGVVAPVECVDAGRIGNGLGGQQAQARPTD